MSAHASHVSTLIWTLQQEYSLKDLGALTYFLGIHAVRSSQGLHLSQFKYFTELLHLAHMVGAKSCSIPTTSSSKLSLLDGISLSLSEAIEYRQIFLFNIALLLNSTLPSMSTNCANLCTLPLQLTGLLLKESSGISKAPFIIGFFFFFFLSKSSLTFHAFCDSDWVGGPDDRRSTTGFGIFLGSCLVSWSGKKQSVVARSSTEAKYAL